MASLEDIPNPPCYNPSKYCRFCFSQFRVEPLFPATSSSQLPSIIASLVQIDLHPETDSGASICRMCREQITQFHLFRDRCRLLDQSLRGTKPASSSKVLGTIKNEADFWLEVEPCEEFSSDDEGSNQNFIPQSAKKAKTSGSNSSFWKAFSGEVGVVPEHICNALEMAGFYQSTSLSMISATTIRQIEQNVRDSVDLIVTQAASEGLSREVALRKYFGPLHCHNPTKFSFYAGEIQTILAIAAAVQENGITPYLKTVPIQEALTDAEYIEQLVKKIRAYYKARNPGTEKFKRFFAGLPGPENCKVERTLDGHMYVRLGCTFCKTEMRIRWKETFFTYNNFVAHCDARHYQTEAEFERKNSRANKRRRPRPLTMDQMVEDAAAGDGVFDKLLRQSIELILDQNIE